MSRGYTCSRCKGQGHGKDECGKSRIPSAVSTAPSALDEPTANNDAFLSHDATYALFKNAVHTPEPITVRKGVALPGTPYTCMRVEYRNPETGHVRVEWSGEMHGEWESDRDPAGEALASLSGSSDGYLPYRAVLSAPNPDVPNAWVERDVNLLNGGVRDIMERVFYRSRAARN